MALHAFFAGLEIAGIGRGGFGGAALAGADAKIEPATDLTGGARVRADFRDGDG
jgi:hypothetical protein